jgi:hypothetical protein
VLQGGPRAADRDDRHDTRAFSIGRRLTHENWDAPVAIGHRVNQRFLDHQLEACQCAPDATTLQRVVLPSIEDGLPAPGMRFGEPRTMALLACLCRFEHLVASLTNRSLREPIAGLIPGPVPERGCCGCCRAVAQQAREGDRASVRAATSDRGRCKRPMRFGLPPQVSTRR